MNLPPAARGSQEAGITQPRARLLADPSKLRCPRWRLAAPAPAGFIEPGCAVSQSVRPLKYKCSKGAFRAAAAAADAAAGVRAGGSLGRGVRLLPAVFFRKALAQQMQCNASGLHVTCNLQGLGKLLYSIWFDVGSNLFMANSKHPMRCRSV